MKSLETLMVGPPCKWADLQLLQSLLPKSLGVEIRRLESLCSLDFEFSFEFNLELNFEFNFVWIIGFDRSMDLFWILDYGLELTRDLFGEGCSEGIWDFKTCLMWDFLGVREWFWKVSRLSVTWV